MQRHLYKLTFLILSSLLVLPCGANETPKTKETKETKHAITIYQGKILKGWTTGGWLGTSLTQKKDPKLNRNILLINVKAKSKIWAGVFLATIQVTGQTQAEFKLTDNLKKKGVLVLVVNGSENEWGQHVGNQHIQIALGQRLEKWKWKQSKYLDANKYLKKGRIDDQPDTWQAIKIPLADLLQGAGLPAVGAVHLQYIGYPTPMTIQSIYIE